LKFTKQKSILVPDRQDHKDSLLFVAAGVGASSPMHNLTDHSSATKIYFKLMQTVHFGTSVLLFYMDFKLWQLHCRGWCFWSIFISLCCVQVTMKVSFGFQWNLACCWYILIGSRSI